MHPRTVHLHRMLIRLARGMINAWDDWLRDVAAEVQKAASTTHP